MLVADGLTKALLPKRKKPVMPKRDTAKKRRATQAKLALQGQYTDMFNPNAQLDTSRVKQLEYLPPNLYDMAQMGLDRQRTNVFLPRINSMFGDTAATGIEKLSGSLQEPVIQAIEIGDRLNSLLKGLRS